MATVEIPTDPRFKNLTGTTFGRLRVVSFAGNRKENNYWNCVCECGNQSVVDGGKLRSGHTKSCGCYKIERLAIDRSTHGHCRVGRRSPEYRSWAMMLTRCYNHGNPGYKWYGAVGVRVCDAWKDSFEAFLADMGQRPSAKHSIDRFPDRNGNYEPGNCRWATAKEQQRNRRNNHRVTFQGRTQCLSAWAEELKIDRSLLLYRLDHWSVERALTTAVL